MTFKIKSCLTALIICTQIYCLPASENTVLLPDSSSTRRSETGVSEEIGDIDALLIYTHITTVIVWRRDVFPGFELDALAGSKWWVVHRDRTVVPGSYGKIVVADGIDKELVAELERVAKKEKGLPQALGDKLVDKPLSGTEAPDVFLEKAKRKYPQTKAILAFSRIALSKDGSQSLIYVEYYSEAKGLIPMYFVVPLKPAEQPDKYGRRYDIDEGDRKIQAFDARGSA
jgi:hypothetical protein